MDAQTLYLAMAEACIDELDRDERLAIPEDVFGRVIKICAQVADDRQPRSLDSTDDLTPPRTVFIRAQLLRPGDWVWQTTKAAFDAVECASIDVDGIYITWMGGGLCPYQFDDIVRVAANRLDAPAWNHRVAELDPGLLHELLAHYSEGE